MNFSDEIAKMLEEKTTPLTTPFDIWKYHT